MMKSRINLYQEQFKPTVILISLNFSIVLWLLVLIGTLSAGFAVIHLQKSAEQRALLAAQAVSDKTAVLNLLLKGRDGKSQNPALLSELEQTQKQLGIKKVILEELANREEQKSRGFSALMVDLASNHQSDLWLTEINLDDSLISIKGGASDSTALPVWVSKLSAANYFVGKEFAAARLFRDENEQLQFILSSDINDAQQGGGNER